MDIKQDIQPVGELNRRASEIIKRVNDTQHATFITVNGRVKAVLQDADSYQKMMDMVETAEAIIGVQKGLEDVKAGRYQPLKKSFAKISKKYNFSDEAL